MAYINTLLAKRWVASMWKPNSNMFRRRASNVPIFATADPYTLNANDPHTIENLVDGKWQSSQAKYPIVDPMNGEIMAYAPNTQGVAEFQPFVESLRKVSRSGKHNAFKNPERFKMYGEVLGRAAALLNDPQVFHFMVKCIQRTMPKHYAQAAGEVHIVQKFCENFSGDSLRFLMRGFSVSGDYMGQQSRGYRWPYGAVGIISPFNFPLEIPGMQMLSAAMVGNKPIVKCHSSQGLVIEQFLRLLHHCGLPMDDIDFISAKGPNMYNFLEMAPINLLQFTGGATVASKLTGLMKGRVRIEDAGFDWKILGPKVEALEYVAWQCDQDAYAMSGQKCSAQSLLFAHSDWVKAGIFEKLKVLAARRSFEDMTCSPILSWTNTEISKHIDDLLNLPGSRLLFGGSPMANVPIPSCYGAFEPTAVYVPFKHFCSTREVVDVVTKEVFGPVQVITEWEDADETALYGVINSLSHHLTAAIVSNDIRFLQRFLGETIVGTTYVGQRARTTGAPQSHWFGPGGNPIGAGIGSPEAVLHTWTAHREIVEDYGPLPDNWSVPVPT